MFGKTQPALLLFALVLAVLTVWAAHTAAQATGAVMLTCELAEHVQLDAGVEPIHASHLGDHHHDVPHLIAALSAASPVHKALRRDAAPFALAPSPIYLIKRPPRAWLLT
ncbi:MAG: hypothetical protein AAAB16_15925 [Pseudomonas sp.]|uniref:hypothetical protein n=1 Tax=Pseudomonas sp. TaxID=306 RepID=UPI0030F2E53A